MICSSHPASELRSRLQGWYTDHCRIRKRWWGKSEDLCHCRLNSKKFGPFHDVYFRAKCLGEAWMGRWRSQSKTVSHKYRITTIVTISLEWHFKSVCFFPLNLLHPRDVLNRKIPETIYFWYLLMALKSKNILHLLPLSQEHVQDHVLPIWYRCARSTFETSRW